MEDPKEEHRYTTVGQPGGKLTIYYTYLTEQRQYSFDFLADAGPANH